MDELEGSNNFKYAPSEQEIAFAVLYAKTTDPEYSWLGAGFDDLGSTKNIRKGLSLVKTKKIQERLSYEGQLTTQKGHLSIDKLFSHVNAIAYANPANYHEPDGTYKKFSDLTEEEKYPLKDYELAPNGRLVRFRLHDPAPFLEKIAKGTNAYERHTQANAPKIVLSLGSQKVLDS